MNNHAVHEMLVTARERTENGSSDFDRCVGCILADNGTDGCDGAYEIVSDIIGDDMHDWSFRTPLADRLAVIDRAIAQLDAQGAK